MRKSWLIIKGVINKNHQTAQKLPKITINGKTCDNPKILAETFNNYFTHIGPILDKKIQKIQLARFILSQEIIQ